MLNCDADTIRSMLFDYLNDDKLDGLRNDKIYGDLSYLAEQMDEIEWNSFDNGEVDRVLNSLQVCSDGETDREDQRKIRGVKAEDVAFIATHYGFIFGLLWAENARLNFWGGKKIDD